MQLPGQGLWGIGHGGQTPGGPTQPGGGNGGAAQALEEPAAVELHDAVLGRSRVITSATRLQ